MFNKKSNKSVAQFVAETVANEMRKDDLQRGYANVQSAAKSAKSIEIDVTSMTSAQRLAYLRNLGN